MSYKLNRQQYESVLCLPDSERFYHFIARIVDWEEVWSLKSDTGWVTVESEGRKAAPFWPHPEYAQAFANQHWQGTKPESITLEKFVKNWLPGMEKDALFAAVFPNLNMQGIVVEPYRVQLAINEELENY